MHPLIKVFGFGATALAAESAAVGVSDINTAAMWQGITAIVATVGTCVTAYIAFKQAALSRDMRTLERNTNSIKDELVRATHAIGRAEGVIAGRAEGLVTDGETERQQEERGRQQNETGAQQNERQRQQDERGERDIGAAIAKSKIK